VTVPVPNLDDRTFTDLVDEAVRRVRATSPEWTDFGVGDPGRTLIEVFAFLTETMLYRINRLPEAAYRQFLRMIGTSIEPAAAAGVDLVFSHPDGAAGSEIAIPRGTLVTVGNATVEEPPVFATTRAAALRPGDEQVTVRAHHCVLQDGEFLGTATGRPGLSLQVDNVPIVRTGDEDDVVVAVEAQGDELQGRVPALEFRGKTYRIWEQVESFVGLTADDPVYRVDRSSGLITFAPLVEGMARQATALAAVPPGGRSILGWYRTGGGPEGNVAAGTLDTVVEGPTSLEVTNPERATGGQGAESLESALVRGPQLFHMGGRVITARDYELRAMEQPSVSRARAFTRRDLWAYAPPGEVEVVLVPEVTTAPDHVRHDLATILSFQTPLALETIRADLDRRRPLGSTCIVDWARYKSVSVRARVVVRNEEDRDSVKRRVLERLYRTITPLRDDEKLRPTDRAGSPGWEFGQPLRLSDVFDILLAEPGVTYADQIRFVVDEVPDVDVLTLARDEYQTSTWYAGSASTLFRSMNDGVGWEPVRRFDEDRVVKVVPYPNQPEARPGMSPRPGYVAVATEGDAGSAVYISTDLGETWPLAHSLAFDTNDLAWIERGGEATLLLATDKGLYEVPAVPGGNLDQIAVDPTDEELGFYAVAAFTDVTGDLHIGVAARERKGVYLSSRAGRDDTFEHLGLPHDIRVLIADFDGPTTYLLAGAAADGGNDGMGAFRMRLAEADPSWQELNNGWIGGSCFDLAAAGDVVYGASHHAGVQRYDLRTGSWTRPGLSSGLPLRQEDRLFHPVRTVALNDDGEILLAGGGEGVFRSDGAGTEYSAASEKEYEDAVTLPGTWLFASGEHAIEVVSEHETRPN